MEEHTRKRTVEIRFFRGRTIVILLVILILFSVAIPAGSFYFQKYQARTVLRHGKNLFLAVNIAEIEAYARNTSFLNANTETGVSSDAEAGIYLSSMIQGDFYISQWNKSSGGTCELYYWEDGYMAHMVYKGKSDVTWKVYKIKQMAGIH